MRPRFAGALALAMALHSMTAFARETLPGPVTLALELRSVNHRYLDCHFKLPDNLGALESTFREGLGKRFKRGKIDCQLRVLGERGGSPLAVDRRRLEAVLAGLATVSEAAPQLAPPDALAVLGYPGVCEGPLAGGGGDGDEEALYAQALALFDAALDNLARGRAREGARLAECLQRRLEALLVEVGKVRGALPALRERQEERLRRRLEELEQPVDAGRLEQELVLHLQKSDVDEELDRLEAHVEEIGRVLAAGGPCGRRLDFLMQELNREANTLSSKATAASTTRSAVELKVLIEQMREQVQNVE